MAAHGTLERSVTMANVRPSDPSLLLGANERAQMWVRDDGGRLRLRRSLSTTALEEHSWNVVLTAPADEPRKQPLMSARRQQKIRKQRAVLPDNRLTISRAKLPRKANAWAEEFKWDEVMKMDFLLLLEDRGLGPSKFEPKSAAGAAGKSSTSSAKAHFSADHEEREAKKKPAVVPGLVISKSGEAVKVTNPPDAGKSARKQALAQRLKTEKVQSGAFPGIKMHTDALTPEQMMAARIKTLETNGIEVGSSHGSALILAGDLAHVIHTLSNWTLSSVKDKEIEEQIIGFFWTYEFFANHITILKTIISVYQKPPSEGSAAALPPAALAKFRARHQQGVVTFLARWLNDGTLSPTHRDFLAVAEFRSTLDAFLASLPADDPVVVGARDSIARFVANPVHVPVPRSSSHLLLADVDVERIAPRKAKGSFFAAPIKGSGELLFTEPDVFVMTPRELAEQLTYLDYDSIMDLDPYDLIYTSTWSKHSPPEHPIIRLATRAQCLSGWASRQILEQSNLKKRAQAYENIVLTCQKLYEFNDFHSLMHLLSGLNHGAIMRLRKTEGKLSSYAKKRKEKLTAVMSQYSAYKTYRQKLTKAFANEEPCVPCIDVLLRDFVLADENPSFCDDKKRFLNFDKCMFFVTYMENIKNVRRLRYPFSHADESARDRAIRVALRDKLPQPMCEEDMYKISQTLEPRTKQA